MTHRVALSRALLWGGLLLAVLAARPAVSARPAPAPTVVQDPRPTVVLLHGLGRSDASMGVLARTLEEAGYRVVNLGYPSRSHGVRVLADSMAAALDRCCPDVEPLHFVTHSLGGILVRAYGATHGSHRIGRVVMLSPPNRGSEVVDRIPDRLLELVLGPAAVELGTDTTSLPRSLPPVDFELGIITGSASMNPLFSWWIPGEDDGKVAVESARVEGAEDFLVVPYSHTWIMRRAEVVEQVLVFLASGRFDPRGRDS